MTKLRIREAASYLGVSDDTVRRWADTGQLPCGTDEHNRKVIDGLALALFAREHAAVLNDATAVTRSDQNHFVGLVTSVEADQVMAKVELQCGPYRFVSVVTAEAVAGLGLEPGALAVAVVRAADVGLEVPKRPERAG